MATVSTKLKSKKIIMSHSTENRGVLLTFQDKMSQLRQVKGVTKKKLKAQEYNLKRKMGICFICDSTNHTLDKCPEKAIKHDMKKNICVPHAVETGRENKELPPQQLMETVTKNYHEECSNMLTYKEVDKVDNLLLDNLLETLGPGPKKLSIVPEHPSLNAQHDSNHVINGEEIGNQYQLGSTEFQENIQYETINPDEIRNFAIPIEEMGMVLQDKEKSDKSFFDAASDKGAGVDSKNTMTIDTEKCVYFSYTTIIDEDNIPLVIPRGMHPEKSENLLPKKKTSTRKVGRPKKSTVGIRCTNNALKMGPEVDSKNMSINTEKCLPISSSIVLEDHIPLVIPRVIVPEKTENMLPEEKNPTRKVGRPKKSSKPTK